jgi:IS5 family transposase
MTCKRTKYKHYVDKLQKKTNRSKSRVRTKVEHAFRVLTGIFGCDKVRYRGSARTTTGSAPASRW